MLLHYSGTRPETTLTQLVQSYVALSVMCCNKLRVNTSTQIIFLELYVSNIYQFYLFRRTKA